MVTLVGEVLSGCTNWNSVGDATSLQNLTEGIEGALRAASATKENVRGITLGMAGVDRPADQEKLQKMVLSILPHTSSFNIVNDAEVALASGTQGVLEGICVISGTGHIAIGRNKGVSVRAAGWGPLLGDQGSGYNIAMMGLAAITKAEDQGSHTILTDLVLKELELSKVSDLITWAYKDHDWARFAALSKLVYQAADQDDGAAKAIIETASTSLAANINTVYNRGGFEDAESVNIVFAGGNLTFDDGKGRLASRLRAILESQHKNIKILLPVIDPAHAAALMAKHDHHNKPDKQGFLLN